MIPQTGEGETATKGAGRVSDAHQQAKRRTTHDITATKGTGRVTHAHQQAKEMHYTRKPHSQVCVGGGGCIFMNSVDDDNQLTKNITNNALIRLRDSHEVRHVLPSRRHDALLLHDIVPAVVFRRVRATQDLLELLYLGLLPDTNVYVSFGDAGGGGSVNLRGGCALSDCHIEGACLQSLLVQMTTRRRKPLTAVIKLKVE